MGLFVALLFVAAVAVAAGAEHHGHAHSHSHGHGHHHGEEEEGHHRHDHGHEVHASHHGHHHKAPKEKAEQHHGHSHAHAHHAPAGAVASRNVWVQAVLATVAIGCAPVLILFFMPPLTGSAQAENTLKTLLGFAVGGLLGDVFLHLLPHSYEEPHGAAGGHSHTHGTFVGLSLLAGVLVFFVIEKWVRSKAASYGNGGHAHTHSHGSHEGDDPAAKGKKPGKSTIAGVDVTGWLNLVADFSHNFTDGLAIGASFAASERLGYVTTVAVLVHEVPHEIGDYAILVKSGMSKRGAMLSQLFTATGCLLGTVVSLLASNLASSSQWILPFTAGGFIYIACTTVLPDLLQDNSLKQSAKEVVGFLLGVGMMVLVAMFE